MDPIKPHVHIYYIYMNTVYIPYIYVQYFNPTSPDWLGSADFARSSLTTSRLPFHAASMSGVSPPCRVRACGCDCVVCTLCACIGRQPLLTELPQGGRTHVPVCWARAILHHTCNCNRDTTKATKKGPELSHVPSNKHQRSTCPLHLPAPPARCTCSLHLLAPPARSTCSLQLLIPPARSTCPTGPGVHPCVAGARGHPAPVERDGAGGGRERGLGGGAAFWGGAAAAPSHGEMPGDVCTVRAALGYLCVLARRVR